MKQDYIFSASKMILKTNFENTASKFLLYSFTKTTFLIFFLLGTQNNIAQTFDFETATGSGTNTVTETIDGITLTVTANDGLDNLNVYNYSQSFGKIIGPVELSNTNSMTFYFSSAVNIESIFAFEISGDYYSTWTYTPTGGTNPTINNLISDFGLQTVNLNWTNVTAFTVTKPVDVTVFGFDRLIFTPATLGIEDSLNESLQFYPNPINNLLYLKAPTNISVTDIIVYNGLGNVVKSSNTTTIDFSSLASGLYYAKMVTDKGAVIKKVVKK